MLAPAVSQFSINFVTDEGNLCLTRPARERFHIGAIKHASCWITGSVHEQDAWIRPVFASPGHRLRKGLWGQTMMIMWLGLPSDQSPAGQECHRINAASFMASVAECGSVCVADARRSGTCPRTSPVGVP